MDAKISNGIGSDYVVLTNKNQICSGAFVMFPVSDRLALELIDLYCERLPDTDSDKVVLRNWITQLSTELVRSKNSKRWEIKDE